MKQVVSDFSFDVKKNPKKDEDVIYFRNINNIDYRNKLSKSNVLNNFSDTKPNRNYIEDRIESMNKVTFDNEASDPYLNRFIFNSDRVKQRQMEKLNEFRLSEFQINEKIANSQLNSRRDEFNDIVNDIQREDEEIARKIAIEQSKQEKPPGDFNYDDNFYDNNYTMMNTTELDSIKNNYINGYTNENDVAVQNITSRKQRNDISSRIENMNSLEKEPTIFNSRFDSKYENKNVLGNDYNSNKDINLSNVRNGSDKRVEKSQPLNSINVNNKKIINKLKEDEKSIQKSIDKLDNLIIKRQNQTNNKNSNLESKLNNLINEINRNNTIISDLNIDLENMENVINSPSSQNNSLDFDNRLNRINNKINSITSVENDIRNIREEIRSTRFTAGNELTKKIDRLDDKISSLNNLERQFLNLKSEIRSNPELESKLNDIHIKLSSINHFDSAIRDIKDELKRNNEYIRSNQNIYGNFYPGSNQSFTKSEDKELELLKSEIEKMKNNLKEEIDNFKFQSQIEQLKDLIIKKDSNQVNPYQQFPNPYFNQMVKDPYKNELEKFKKDLEKEMLNINNSIKSIIENQKSTSKTQNDIEENQDKNNYRMDKLANILVQLDNKLTMFEEEDY